MGSVYEEITRLETAKTEIETAIEGCGVDVPDTELISDYAQYIKQIPSAVFSGLTVDPVGGEDMYIKSIKQENGLINAATGGLVSSTSSGLVPKITTATVLIDNQSIDWVLTSTNGAEPQWKKLPVTSFAKYIGTTEVQSVSQAQELKGITNIYNTDNKEILHSGDYFELNKGYPNSKFWFNGSEYKFNVGTSTLFMIGPNGNVGIGNVGGKPKTRLHVAGGGVLADEYKAWSGGFSKEGCSDAQLLLAGGGHMNLTGLFTELTSSSTTPISLTVGNTTKTISKTTLASSLGLGTNAYSSTAYLPLDGGTMTGDISWNTDSHGIYFYNGCGIEKYSGYAPTLVAEGDSTDFYIRNGQNRSEYHRILHAGNYKRYVDPQIFPGLNATGTVTSITITQGTGIEVSDSGVEITTTGTRTISLSEASSSAIGGVQLGYTASGANIPLQTSSKRGYVALTKAAIVAALGYTPPEFDTNVTQTNTTSNSTYRVLLSGSANDITETNTTKKSTKLQFNTYTGKMDLSGSLQITTSIADHNSPAAQCLVINSTEIPSGTTLSLKNSPGIGFHIANNSWASLIWGPGGFNFINSDANGYANLKAGSGTFSGQIISSVDTGTSPFNVISTTVNTNLNADMVDGYHVATSGDHKPWGMIVSIGDTGVSEMGRYIDYHYDNTTGSDYSTRLQCDGNHGNTVTLPSGTGTLALTSQIPTNTWRSITDSYSGTDSNISLSQKGGNALYNALLNGYASSAGNAETVDDYHIWTGSALEYAGITHDASTLYFITD